MGYENYLNLDERDLDRPIYRVMPVRRLLQAFAEEELALVPPHTWDDPFENLLLSSEVQLTANGETAGLKDIRNKVYGQCWTQHRETDAMWRIYSSDTHGAKVRSTPRALLQALQQSDARFGDVTCFIGKVEYLNQKNLVSTLQGLDLFKSNGSGIAKSLLYKRNEFSHEREVRVIYTEGNGSVHRFGIDPRCLFEEIVFDPRMDSHLYQAYRDAILNYGYGRRIAQSVLYQPPDGLRLHM